jgi:sugar phosphate isomerase/epimerase
MLGDSKVRVDAVRFHQEDALPRPKTMLTGQWADLPISELAAKAGSWGLDGLELACWGDHFDVVAALRDRDYVRRHRELLDANGLQVWAVSNHLVGQCICDPVDVRHSGMIPAEIWGDGEPEGVRRRAAERLADTARAAALLGVTTVHGFSGSSIWHMFFGFPPNDWDAIEAGYADFAERFTPILEVFAAEGVRFALEVHPTEIAYDFVTTRKTLAAIGRRPEFGLNLDPSHFIPWGLDPAEFAYEFGDRIYHVHIKDSRRKLNGRRSLIGGHLDFGSPDRGWDFVSPGRGEVDFDSMLRALNDVGYEGPLSLEWEDSGMDREFGAQEALAFIRQKDFPQSEIAFDAAFERTPS